MRTGYARYYVRCTHENKCCGEYASTIGRANTLKSAKSIIRNFRNDGGRLGCCKNFEVRESETGKVIHFEF